ncbi:small-conductance mechanosensitive channel [Bradyrhizobium sp. USDA 4518]
MTIAPSTPADARPRSALPLLVGILALIVAGGALWMSYNNATRLATSQEHAAVAPPPDTAVEQIKQTLASIQQAVQGIQADQQRQAERVGDAQQKAAAQQGEQKLISDQLSALSARVNSLESARAESPTPDPQAAPAPQRRTKR